MCFQLLPIDLLTQIVSFTNDDTIHALACTCKTLNSIIKENQDKIEWEKYNNQQYDLYGNILQYLHSTINNKRLNIDDCWTESHHLSMYLLTLMLLHKIDGENDFDVITSIRVKGDVHSVTLTVGQEIHMTLNLHEHIKNQIICCSDQGDIEILTPFLDFIPVYSLHAYSSFMSLQSSGGDVIVDIKKAKLKTKSIFTERIMHRMPTTFYNKVFDGVVPKYITVPVSCTWSNDFACITFNKAMNDILDRIHLVDAKFTKIYDIAAKRLEVFFLQDKSNKVKWLDAGTKHTKYIIPLVGHGGMYNIVLLLKNIIKDLSIFGVRWQEKVVECAQTSQE